ncbi:hypothetical protein IID22_04725 [Patescibacteria group bacterium]|nr:hypothetical protein [Patescibacteria group bacterium]
MTKSKSTGDLVKEVLADLIGVESEDIELEDSLRDNLHMGATDLSDSLKLLGDRGINTDRVDLTEIASVADLVDSLDSGALIE